MSICQSMLKYKITAPLSGRCSKLPRAWVILPQKIKLSDEGFLRSFKFSFTKNHQKQKMTPKFMVFAFFGQEGLKITKIS